VPAGDSAFSPAQQGRLQRAVQQAETQTGLCFTLVVGPIAGDPREQAERALARVADGRPVGAVVVLVDPGGRQLEIATTPVARRRVDDQACALVALSMTSSFSVGDLVGGLINGLRMLADAAGQGSPDRQLAG